MVSNNLKEAAKVECWKSVIPRAQYLSMILLKTHLLRLDYCIKREENLTRSGPQLYLFLMFTSFSKSKEVSHGTSTSAMTSPSSVMNPRRALVEACLRCFFFPSKTDPDLPILLTQILLKPPIYTIHHPRPWHRSPLHSLPAFLTSTKPGSSSILSPLHPTARSPSP